LFQFGDADLRAIQRGRAARQFLAQLVAFGLGLPLPGLRVRDRELRLVLRGGQLFLRRIDRPRPVDTNKVVTDSELKTSIRVSGAKIPFNIIGLRAAH
jgi:hypothetical protein